MSTDSKKAFAKKLKELRAKNDVTQQELADAIGLSLQTISAYENNYKKGKMPTLDKVMDIADFFGVSIDWLVGRNFEESHKEWNGNPACNIRSLADLLNYIQGLCRFLGTDCETAIGEEKTLQGICLEIDVYDKNLIEAWKPIQKMLQLLADGAIDENLYSTWLSGELKKYEYIEVGHLTDEAVDMMLERWKEAVDGEQRH